MSSYDYWTSSYDVPDPRDGPCHPALSLEAIEDEFNGTGGVSFPLLPLPPLHTQPPTRVETTSSPSLETASLGEKSTSRAVKRPREDNGHENSDREDSNRQLRPVLAKSPALDSGRSTMTPANRKKPRTDKEVIQAGVYQGGQQSRKCDLCPEETSYTYTLSDIAGAIGHFKKAHLPQVGGDGNVICPWPDCQRSYGGVGTLVRHVREKHLEVRFQCENCGAVLERFNGAHTCIQQSPSTPSSSTASPQRSTVVKRKANSSNTVAKNSAAKKGKVKGKRAGNKGIGVKDRNVGGYVEDLSDEFQDDSDDSDYRPN
ncbi:hypothetical protein C8Q76DRAFT_694446 [Earliella scabrosa]|nr:hypothetical protein C8Q76DRAFT_694446 [Earliella scabrosa]